MKATIVDLRYKMNDVLKALDRNEQVTVLYRGKVKGVLMPEEKKSRQKMTDHPFFGMAAPNKTDKKADKKPVSEIMDDLRGPRYE